MAERTRETTFAGAQKENVLSHRAEERWLSLALILCDSISVTAGFALAYLIRFHSGLPIFQVTELTGFEVYGRLILVLLPVWLMLFAIFQLYTPQQLLGGTQEYARVFNASTLGTMIVIFAGFLEPEFIIARGWLLLAWALIIVCATASRFGVRRAVYALRTAGHFVRRAVIVGANPEGLAVAEQLASAPKSGFRVVGFLDEELAPNTEVMPGMRVLGTSERVESLVASRQVSEVIVVSDAVSRERLLDIFQTLGTSKDVNVRLSSGLFEIMTTGVTVKECGSVPLLSINRVRLTGSDAFLKSVLDYTVTLAALVLLTPVMLLIALLVKLDSSGPVLYRRRVLGINGKPFDAFKFRTMVTDADQVLERNPELKRQFESNCKLKEDPRVTRVGRWLRRMSLDELPQLLNVLRGEMSLVGPRMITPEEQCRYGKWGMNLLTVKPGLTGIWQISGRANLSYAERVRLDMYYVRNYSIWIDLRLLLQTIPAVLKGIGAY